MTFPEVKIVLQSGKLGRIDDEGNGVPGLIVLMATAPAPHAFGDVKAYSSFDELPTGLKAVKGVETYFKAAPGYKVYIMPIASTTAVADAIDPANATPYALNLVRAGNGEIRFIGVIGSLLLANLTTCITNAQTLRTTLLAEKNPIRTFLPYSFRTADVIPNLLLRSDNGVGVVVSYSGEEMGLLLGRLASTPVQRHPGRVKDGSMPIVDALLDGAAGTPTYIKDNPTKVKELHDKGFIVLGTLIGKAGFFFMGMPMATAATDDYATIVNCRTIDKAYVIAYKIYLEELNEEVYVTPEGKLQPGYVKGLQASIEKALDLQMLSRNEISYRSAFFDDQQNVVATSEVEGTVTVGPVGHSSVITINLGF